MIAKIKQARKLNVEIDRESWMKNKANKEKKMWRDVDSSICYK